MNKNSIRIKQPTVTLLTEKHGFLIDRNIKNHVFISIFSLMLNLEI